MIDPTTGRLIVPIDRATWERGAGKNASYRAALLNAAGNRCCLGFLGRECGLTNRLAKGRPSPRDRRYDAAWPDLLWENIPGKESRISLWKTDVLNFEDALIACNDVADVPDEIREAWIAEGFRAIGCEVRFEGEGRP